MSDKYSKDTKSALEAKFDAQKIAFGPIMFQAALSLRNLGILALIKKKSKGISMEDIAKELNLSVYGVKVLLEAGLSLEMVIVNDGLYRITKTGWYILSDELTKVNMNFTQDVCYEGMFTLEDSIKENKPTGLKVFGDWPDVYVALAELPQHVRKSWFEFDHYYSDGVFETALPILFNHSPKKLLDVGGNTGKFSIQCANFNKEVDITILDLPGQLNDARKNIEKNGLIDRIKGIPMNLLDHSVPFPTEVDMVWMSQFLDCFSQEDILELLKRAAAAIKEEGRVCILETYWDNQEYEASTYSLHATSLYFTNIANGNSQMYHTQDMINLVDKAGLVIDETHNELGVSHTLFICKKK